MAVIYSRKQDGILYEIRTAGASKRLYTNGAFHTQFNPNHLFTGAVWDLLSLPVLCKEQAPRTILVLGVAGGTVIHQLQSLCDNIEITGIELDPMHIQLARSHFDLRYDNLTVIQADARDWLMASNSTYDCIIDDIFLHGESDPERPVALDKSWFKQLKAHLNRDGVLIQNHIDESSAKVASSHMKGGAILGFHTEMYANIVLAWYRDGQGAKAMRQRLAKKLEQLPARTTSRLRADVSRFRA